MELAKKLEQWRDGGTREARFLIGAADGHSRRGTAGRRPPAIVRPGDLAALARPRDARRAIVPGDINPCEPPLSSRRLRHAWHRSPRSCNSPDRAADRRRLSQPVREPLELRAKRALAEARAAEAQLARLQKAADEAEGRGRTPPRATGCKRRSDRPPPKPGSAQPTPMPAPFQRRLRYGATGSGANRRPRSALLGGLAVMAERPPLLAILDQGSTRGIRSGPASARLDASRHPRAYGCAQGRAGTRPDAAAAGRGRPDAIWSQSRDMLAERRREFAEPGSQSAEDRRTARRRGARRRRHRAGTRRGSRTARRRSSAGKLSASHCRRAGGLARTARAAGPGHSQPGRGRLRLRPPGVGPGRRRPGIGRPERSPLAGPDAARPLAGRPSSCPAIGNDPISPAPSGAIDGDCDHRSRRRLDEPAPERRLAAKAGRRASPPAIRSAVHLVRIGVELSRNGRHVSPALIAGSSQTLSKGR